jgi:hypothetical protein
VLRHAPVRPWAGLLTPGAVPVQVASVCASQAPNAGGMVALLPVRGQPGGGLAACGPCAPLSPCAEVPCPSSERDSDTCCAATSDGQHPGAPAAHHDAGDAASSARRVSSGVDASTSGRPGPGYCHAQVPHIPQLFSW